MKMGGIRGSWTGVFTISLLFIAVQPLLAADPPPGQPGQPQQLRHTLWMGTGEYSMMDDWHGVLRFDDAHLINGTVAPNGTVNHRSSTNPAGVTLDFGHDIYVTKGDTMFIAFTFSNDSGGEGCNVAPGSTTNICGSIGVLGNASSMNGPQTLSRQIYGDLTGLHDPHGVWVDESRDMIYVANSWAAKISIWHNARTVNGNVPPDREITFPTSQGYPIDVMLDETTDRLFVAFANGVNGSIGIFEHASSKNGSVDPDHRITGTHTRIGEGNNPTTHNSVLIPGRNLLVVGHHTNEVLFYDLTPITWGSTFGTVDYDLTPRVIYINETASDTWDWSCYGMAYAMDQDALYVSAGYTPGGTSTSSSSPHRGGSPEHAVKVFMPVSDPAMAGLVTPAREINWTTGTQYFPPQPLWLKIAP